MFRGAFVKMASVARHGVGSCARRASAASVGKANHTWSQQSLGQWTCCFWIHKWRFLWENNRTKWRMFIAMFDYQRVFLNENLCHSQNLWSLQNTVEELSVKCCNILYEHFHFRWMVECFHKISWNWNYKLRFFLMESPPCSSKHAHVKLVVDVQTHPNTRITRGSRNPSENRRVHSGKTWSLSETLGIFVANCDLWPVRWPSSQVSVVRIQQWTSCGWQRDGILACTGSRLANVMHPTRPLSPMLSQRWCMAELQDVARCCKMLQDVARCCKMLQSLKLSWVVC